MTSAQYPFSVASSASTETQFDTDAWTLVAYSLRKIERGPFANENKLVLGETAIVRSLGWWLNGEVD